MIFQYGSFLKSFPLIDAKSRYILVTPVSSGNDGYLYSSIKNVKIVIRPYNAGGSRLQTLSFEYTSPIRNRMFPSELNLDVFNPRNERNSPPHRLLYLI
jgi:hypothetical protein